MSILFLAAVLIAAIGISEQTGEDVFDTLPLTAGAGILLLYALAFFRALQTAGLFAVVAAFGVLAVGYRRARKGCDTASDGSVPERKDGSSRYLLRTGKQLADPQLLTALAILTAMAVLAADRVVLWWDDLNFWANDAKFLWYWNGFAPKYGHVSPAFGDYPPALSLWKYVFLKLSPDVYREGLQYSAYHVLNGIFLLPLIGETRKWRSLPARLLAVPAVFLLPGAVCGLQFTGAAADVTMGCLYGSILILMSRRREHVPPIRTVTIGVLLGVLTITKETGFCWAIAAAGYGLFVCRKRRAPFILPGLTFGSWAVFCLVNRRIAKLTGEMVRMAKNGVDLPEQTGALARSFLEAFSLRPLHADRNLTMDLPAAGMAGLIIISYVILCLRAVHADAGTARREDHADQPKTGFLAPGAQLSYLTFTGLLLYGLLFFAHLTIFRTEEQYLNPYNMSLSIARYGSPWMLGGLMLLMRRLAGAVCDPEGTRKNGEAGSRKMKFAAMLCFLLLPVLTADHRGEAEAYVTYRAHRAADLTVRSETVDPEGRRFLAAIADRRELWGKRILFLRQETPDHDVKDVFLTYEACPVAVVVADAGTLAGAPVPDLEEAERLAAEYHAARVYMGDTLSEPLSYDKIE